MDEQGDHARYDSGRKKATPNCPCEYCRAVYDEWAEQAIGFQRWFDGLDDHHLKVYFGLERSA